MNDSVVPELKTWKEVGRARFHESAELHVLGQATYTDDIRELAGTLHAALGLSARAHARIAAIDLEPVRASRGVVAVLGAADIQLALDYLGCTGKCLLGVAARQAHRRQHIGLGGARCRGCRRPR